MRSLRVLTTSVTACQLMGSRGGCGGGENAYIMSQMHLAFVHAHNVFVDRARASGHPEAHVFDAAARELVWHYQTIVLREFLPSAGTA